jgi:microcystin-dependent protein
VSEPFVAEIRIFAGNFAPRGWAFCNGQLLPIAQNTALFSLIGTTYGGDGRTTTALPNLQDRLPMHPGRGPGLTSRRLGERGGVNDVTLAEAQLPGHRHSVGAVQIPAPTTANPANAHHGAAPMYKSTSTGVVNLANEAVADAGGGQSHENRQPFLAINFIIALVGLYPSRS